MSHYRVFCFLISFIFRFIAFHRDGRDDLTDRIDFIVCLGGDGTLLYASLLFQQSVPPVMAFHLGSLGFLTPFQFDNFQEQVTNVLEGHAALTLRSRLRCIIVRKNQDEPSESSCEKNWLAHRAIGNDASNGTSTQKPATNILVSEFILRQRNQTFFTFRLLPPFPFNFIDLNYLVFGPNTGAQRSGHRSRTITLSLQY